MRHLDSAAPIPQPSSARWMREGGRPGHVPHRGPFLRPGPAVRRLYTKDPAAAEEGHHAPDVQRAIHRHRHR